MSRPPVVLVFVCLVAATFGHEQLRGGHGHPRGFSDNCLKCICQTDACYNFHGHCPHTWRKCSAFRITKHYWRRCRKPFGKSYSKCMDSKRCKERCVDNYLSYYNPGQDFMFCYRYARIHMAGPWGWRYPWAVPYRDKVNACCSTIPGGCYTIQ
ncbi:hypothetical protein LSAT2_005636 [Lamellibrachia satsuma]|nr:hypothetical protein LSAT2_005636 [Lamellibrachia satsuma]